MPSGQHAHCDSTLPPDTAPARSESTKEQEVLMGNNLQINCVPSLCSGLTKLKGARQSHRFTHTTQSQIKNTHSSTNPTPRLQHRHLQPRLQQHIRTLQPAHARANDADVRFPAASGQGATD